MKNEWKDFLGTIIVLIFFGIIIYCFIAGPEKRVHSTPVYTLTIIDNSGFNLNWFRKQEKLGPYEIIGNPIRKNTLDPIWILHLTSGGYVELHGSYEWELVRTGYITDDAYIYKK